MDISEIRTAFSLSNSKSNRIREFIQSRISEIYSNNPQIPLTAYPKLALHVIPFSSLEITMCDNFDKLLMIPIIPMCSGGANHTFNADGFLAYNPRRDEVLSRGYVQIFHNGMIEAVSSFLTEHDTGKNFPINLIENEIIKGIKNFSKLLKILRVDPPVFIFIHLISVKGLSLPKESPFIGVSNISIQKDVISLPNFELSDLIFETEGHDDYLINLLKLPFDSLANVVGLPRSLSYNDEGKWKRTTLV